MIGKDVNDKVALLLGGISKVFVGNLVEEGPRLRVAHTTVANGSLRSMSCHGHDRRRGTRATSPLARGAAAPEGVGAWLGACAFSELRRALQRL
jgi:hypothetical protein